MLCAALLLLVSCGGGGNGNGNGSVGPAEAGAAADGRKQALAVIPPTPIPADAGSRGMWGPLYTWPLVSVHAVLMPDGRVMSYGSKADGTQTASFSVDLWDSAGTPDSGHMTIPNGTGTEIFCSSQLLLPPAAASSPASVFIAGGDNWTGSATTNTGNNRTTLFNVGAATLSRGADMGRNRWYSSSTTLINGEVYIQGGTGGTDLPEVRQADGSFRTLSNAYTGALQFTYPRNFVLPDGRLFGFDSDGKMYFVNTAGTGGITMLGQFAYNYTGFDGSAAMFRPGRILQVGGNSNAAAVIDLSSGTPVVTPTQSVSSQRRLMSTTLLADGQVLVTGGSAVWNQTVGVNTIAEIWNPTTGQWMRGPAGTRAGLYHSNAVLLPDASVLVTTGGAPAPAGVDGSDHKAQIYYPPYLFTIGGARAARPAIASTADWLEIGKTFSVQTTGSGGISRVTLVKTASSTHGFNMDQRFLDLTFTRSAIAGGNRLAVQAPTRAGEATPGYYMLFVFDDAGVPSEARILRLGIASNPNPQTVPQVTNPGARNGTVGSAASLQVSATDPNGDTLTYSATGLPTGLQINPASGLISGAPTAAGSYNVVVSASDGVNSASASFVWTITGSTPLTLTTTPVSSAALAGSSVSFSASASGVGVQYAWNFGDGSPDTAWSASSVVTKVYSQPGTYVVTLKVRDATGTIISRSLLQTVYLAATPRQPSASANLLVETPASGNPRLWVVNADNDSVTAFDAVSRAKLGEVAVGAAPRSIAPAANGLLWVSNKGSASISVIDPATRAVVRTIALPRASQPFGLAMSPTAAQAFVVLEATGQLLRFDTASYAQTGALAVGPNVRHVSVAADGATVFVSRFITPPLPGESTASIGTPAGSGAEIVQVDASSMTATRTVVLAHSDRPDAENQGSGIPNYLGPLVISPDGSQAYVPGKQDNVKRGSLRNNLPLNFQNTVRAISSRVVLGSNGAASEDPARRIDHDNAGLASAVAFDPRGVLMFVALETSREVAIVNAHSGAQLLRFVVGRAPQGLAVSSDGNTLYVSNFMDRTVGVHDLRPFTQQGLASVQTVATLQSVASERLAPAVLLGKQLFYDARDTRLARDGYMSCASCHNDGGHDGRTWDLTQAGEGLRNTIPLRGRGGNAQGRLHWSGNFDEIQDFEGQIRSLAGGTGLLSDALLAVGSRSEPLGDPKAGLSADLDALAAYLASLDSFAPSPARGSTGALSSQAIAGKAVFAAKCASCHEGSAFTDSGKRVLHDIGTQKASSGGRLGAALNGLDAPTLRDVWATAPYLHDGSAATIEAAISAHAGLALPAADLATVAAYTRQIGAEESAAPDSNANLVVRALATLTDRVGALYEVRVGSSVVGRGQLDATGWVDLVFDVVALVRDTLIEIVFKNDAGNATEDRNLAVQSVKVNGSVSVAGNAAGVVLNDGSSTVAASATGGWIPWNAAMQLRAPDTGQGDSITVRGRATLAGGVGAQMELRINGNLVASRLVANTAVQDLVFSTPAVQAGDRVDVVFTNDALINGEDRNLYVESITLRGVTLPSTATGVTIDAGAGAQAFDGLDVVAASSTGGWIPWDGAMRFTAPAGGSGDSVIVRGRATLAAGVGAQLELRINGVLVGSRLVSNTAVQDMVFATPPVQAGDRIDVVFTNDALINGEDRNLYVESVTAHGVTLPATALGVVIDAGSGPQAFDGLDVVAASSTGGWIPWNGALRLVAR